LDAALPLPLPCSTSSWVFGELDFFRILLAMNAPSPPVPVALPAIIAAVAMQTGHMHSS
jgi:hypothetical protein